MPDTVVYGTYGNRAGLEGVVDALRRFGFRNTDVSVLLAEERITEKPADNRFTKAPEGAGALGWLAGLAFLVVPGAGRLFAAGPVMALLAGVQRSIVGALVCLGLPDFEARRCQLLIEGGDILLVVHCGSVEWVRCTEKVFRNTGAGDIAWSGAASAPFLSMHGRAAGRPGNLA